LNAHYNLLDSLAISLRPAKLDDTDAIVAVVNASTLKTLGVKRILIDAYGKLRFASYIPAKAERMVAVTAEGQVIAFFYLDHQAPYIAAEIGIEIRPDYQERGIEQLLREWAEELTQQRLSLAPAGAKVVLQSNVFNADLQRQALLQETGYQLVREWIHLEINMTEPPPAPLWPAGIEVRLMDQSRDWPRVGPALLEAFVDHWGHIPLEVEAQPEAEAEEAEPDTAGEDDPYHNYHDFFFVALAGAEVAGSCLGDARTIEWPDSGRIGSLSVRRPYRGRGIGQALVLHALNQFYRYGIRRVITDTDGNSFTGANYLYQRAGMTIYRSTRLYEKELRAGHELRVLDS
jgi:GNAT superfamily N-acetyltransferase